MNLQKKFYALLNNPWFWICHSFTTVVTGGILLIFLFTTFPWWGVFPVLVMAVCLTIVIIDMVRL